MMRKAKIEWNGFMDIAMSSSPNEACAFLYSSGPYFTPEIWRVYPIRNVSETAEHEWKPHLKDYKKVKERAAKNKFIELGNIHTHPYDKDWGDVEEQLMPSDTDLKYALQYRSMVRGIMVVDNDAIYGIRFHDPWGREIDISIEEDVVLITGLKQ